MAWHITKTLLGISCSSNKRHFWLFGFPLDLLSTSNGVGLGFGFGSLYYLSFRSSLTLFIFVHPFCGAINFSSSLQSLRLGSINDMATLHFFFLFPQWCPPFPLGVDRLGIGILGHIFGDSFEVIRKNFKGITSFYCISACSGGACRLGSFSDHALFRFYAHPALRSYARVKFNL